MGSTAMGRLNKALPGDPGVNSKVFLSISNFEDSPRTVKGKEKETSLFPGILPFCQPLGTKQREKTVFYLDLSLFQGPLGQLKAERKPYYPESQSCSTSGQSLARATRSFILVLVKLSTLPWSYTFESSF